MQSRKVQDLAEVKEIKSVSEPHSALEVVGNKQVSARRGRLRTVACFVCRAALVIGLSLLALTVAMSYRYGVAFQVAGRSIARDFTQGLILAAVTLYDPCEPALAPHGPASPLPEGAVRLEEYLRTAEKIGGFPRARVEVKEAHNESIIRNRFPFNYQPHAEPRLHELRRRYKLDEVVAGAEDEWSAMVRLRNWTRSRFRRHDYQPIMARFDALEVLDRNLRNDEGHPYDPARHYDPCILFPMLYCQVVLSVGHQARLVSINHGMVEVWSNQHRKWASMDAELNWHYEREGVPLNALEVHNENHATVPSGIRIVRGHQTSGDANTTMVHLGVPEVPVAGMVKYHRYVTLASLRNDWMTNRYFPGHPARGERSTLRFVDPHEPPEQGVMPSLLGHSTSDPTDLYWSLNQAEIWVRPEANDGVIGLAFKTVTPNFDFFEVVLDDGRPARCVGAVHDWRLHDGENRLLVRPVNKFGVRGVASRVYLAVAPTP